LSIKLKVNEIYNITTLSGIQPAGRQRLYFAID